MDLQSDSLQIVLWGPIVYFNRTVAWDFQPCGMCDQQSLRSACTYAQSDQRLCLSLEYSMTVKLLTEHHLEFLKLKGGCTGSSESTLVKMPHWWKSHVTAQYIAQIAYCKDWTSPCLLNLDIFSSENSVDPDQLTSKKSADQDPHCFQFSQRAHGYKCNHTAGHIKI